MLAVSQPKVVVEEHPGRQPKFCGVLRRKGLEGFAGGLNPVDCPTGHEPCLWQGFFMASVRSRLGLLRCVFGINRAFGGQG